MTVGAVEELAGLVGPHRVSVNPTDLQRHSRDRSASALLARRAGRPIGKPICVIRPHTTEQVARVVGWANAHATPVVAYGGGSGVVDAVVADGSVVLEMRSMCEILDFDEKSQLVRTEAGVLGPELVQALESWGYTLGHEPQSIAISTVGGWIATRAVGQLSSRYGGIEDMVASLMAVLPDGTIVQGRTAPRRATGPDIASMMIGSEGTLGVVTQATLRVSPIEHKRADVCIRFEHMTDGVAAARSIAQSDLRPTVLRLYDAEDAEIFLLNHPDEPRTPFMLLSFQGEDAHLRSKRAWERSGGVKGNAALVEHWWMHRNDAVGHYIDIMEGKGALGPTGLVDTVEVSATWSALREVYHSMKEHLADETDLAGCHLSHVYPDGACLYFTLAAACSDDDEAATRLDRWWEIAMRSCLDAGGSISHHHGIGRRKAPWMAEELGGWMTVLRALKSALDPRGIMNPGALGL